MELTVEKDHVEFRKDKAFLSNMYGVTVTLDGITYLNAEAAYHALKYPEEYRNQFIGLSGPEAKGFQISGKQLKLSNEQMINLQNLDRIFLLSKQQNTEVCNW